MSVTIFSKKINMEEIKSKADNEPNKDVVQRVKRLYTCHICNVTSFNRKFPKIHFEKEHYGQYPWKCTTCNKEFLRYEELKKHKSIEHDMVNKETEQYNCYICKATSFNRKFMKIHFKQEHRGQNPWKCFNCSKEFSRNEKLKRHILSVHEGKKIKRSASKRPKQDHNGQNMCLFCKKIFTRKENVKRHFELVHVGKKSKCSLCDKSFARKDRLKKHMRIFHDGKKTHSKPDNGVKNPKERNKLHKAKKNISSEIKIEGE